MRVKILLADDHPLILVGIRRALEAAGWFEVVGTAVKGSQVLPLAARTQPHVTLLDMRMPDLDGLACLERLRRRFPGMKTIMLSVAEDATQIEEALARGASGYIVKTIDPAALPDAIRDVLKGVVTVVRPNPPVGGTWAGLTEREAQILAAVARGLSNQAIARELWVTEQTVKFHLTNIYRKLRVANRTEAARYAYERGLVRAA
jgi:DNA-binding NarL/FixJ family response regulator